MKKATAKQRKHYSSKKKSSAHRKGFLKSGSDIKTLFQLTLAGVALLGTLIGGVYVHEHYIVVVPQGVTFQGQDMSGKNRPEVLALVQAEAYKYEQQNVGVAVGDTEETQTLPAKDWGVEVDVSQTVERFFQSTEHYASADVISATSYRQKKVVIPAIVVKDLEHILAWIHRHEREPRDAQLEFDHGLNQWILSPDREGYQFADDQEALLGEQLKSLLLGDQKVKRLSVKLDRIPATVKAADLQPIYDEIRAMLLPKISWMLDGQTHVFSLADHQDMIVLDAEKNSAELNEDKLKQFIAELAGTIDRAPGEVSVPEPVLQDKGYLKADYQGAFDSGRVLDQVSLFEGILAGLNAAPTVIDGHASAPETTFEAKFSETAPRITLEGVGELTLLSQGQSSYEQGNIPDRIFNVKKGLGKFDGVVIPQGAEFSFNQKLGIVSYQAGWKPALAIFGGGGVAMTPGGGLCQVSTTMYRAAIWSGLPIKQRKAHSLDVSYYHKYGYGIDATIYPPSGLDLRFVNDTPGPIFIHTYTRDDLTEAYVDFYGVSDGRSIELASTDNYSYVNKKTGKHQRYVAWDWLISHLDGSVDERKIETVYYGGH